MKISVRELKDRLSECLRRAQAGEEITVTSHGKPVARLGPPLQAPIDEEMALIEQFRGLPWVRPGKGDKPQGARRPIRIKPGEKTLADIVSEQRG